MKRGQRIVTSAAAVVTVAALVGLRSIGKSDEPNKGATRKQAADSGPGDSARPEPQPDAALGQAAGDEDFGKRQSTDSRVKRLKLLPLWLFLLILTAGFAFLGFEYLPPDQSQDLSGQFSPTIDISVNQPGVKLLAVLDGTDADSGSLAIELYADGVAKGFRWRITSSASTDDLLVGDSVGSATASDDLAGRAAASDQDLYSVLTIPAITPDLQAALRDGGYTPTVERNVLENNSDYRLSGANLQVKFPTIEFDGSRKSTSYDGWFAPSGEVAVLGPSKIATYQTQIVDPDFASPGIWVAAAQVSGPYWSGLDLALQNQESTNLFIAGLLFGISGSALIGAFQDMTNRYREWRES
jgi:hypothetical protein